MRTAVSALAAVRLLIVLAPEPAMAQTHIAALSNALNGVKIVASFDAVSGDPGMSYKDHPDMALAACSACGKAGQVLVATGQDLAVYSTRGTLLKTQNMRDFIKSAGLDPDAWLSLPAVPATAAGKVNDPRATYDPFIKRWIVVCSCSADYLIVSGGMDATGSWKGAVLTGSAGDLTMFPAWDKNGVYVSEFQQPLNSRVIALPAADVAWKGTGEISLAHKGVFSDPQYELRPAVDPNPKKRPSDPEYLIARSGPPQNAKNHAMELVVDRITWSRDMQAAVNGPQRIPSGFLYNTPISTRQPSGQDIRGSETHRVFSVSAHDGHLYLVEASGPCASDCGVQGTDANNLFFWFDIDTGTMTITQKAKVSHPLLGWLFPSLAMDSRGNIGMGATGSSSEQYPSVYLFTHLAGDPTGKINGPFPAHSGTRSYTCDKGPSRPPNAVGWGTYSATVQDGSDPMTLWTLQEYAGSATPCEWKTRVIGFRMR